MSERNSKAREAILGSIRQSLGRKALSADARRELDNRLKGHNANLQPAFDQDKDLPVRFRQKAEQMGCSVVELSSADDIPEAVAEYLRDNNLGAAVKMAPDDWLGGLDWEKAPMLEIQRGAVEKSDLVSLTPAYAGVAETGTLVATSGDHHPTGLNFVPDYHLVALRKSQLHDHYESVWAALRQSHQTSRKFTPPRTINMITGPSRTGDIGHKIFMGAHGPRSMHILLIDDEAEQTPAGKAEKPAAKKKIAKKKSAAKRSVAKKSAAKKSTARKAAAGKASDNGEKA